MISPSCEGLTQTPVNISWDSPSNQEFMLRIYNTDYNDTVHSFENSVIVLLPPGTYSITLCAINRCGNTCQNHPNHTIIAVPQSRSDCGKHNTIVSQIPLWIVHPSPVSLDCLLRYKIYLKDHPPSTSIANREFSLSNRLVYTLGVCST